MTTRRYKYITGEMLTRLDTMGRGRNNPHFSRSFALAYQFGLSSLQANRVIKYWKSIRQIEKLEAREMTMKPQFIEFGRDTMRPFSMYDGEWQYDVEYHRAGNQFYIETSGGGPPYLEGRDNFWWAIEGLRPDIFLPFTGQRRPAPLKNRIELPQEYVDEDTGEPAEVQAWAFHGRLVPCEACEDRVPEDDLCEYLVWDEDEEDYVIKVKEIDQNDQ